MSDPREPGVGADHGFTMIEIVISLMLFALLAVSLLPVLIQGQQLATRQSAEATATRQISALVDSVRANPTCSQVSSQIGSTSYTDGSGRAFTVTTTVSPSIGSCTNNMTVTLSFTAANTGATLSAATALVYIP
jgi:prepilin-type N-terminal cleavage/methylation domain-containing protein